MTSFTQTIGVLFGVFALTASLSHAAGSNCDVWAEFQLKPWEGGVIPPLDLKDESGWDKAGLSARRQMAQYTLWQMQYEQTQAAHHAIFGAGVPGQQMKSGAGGMLVPRVDLSKLTEKEKAEAAKNLSDYYQQAQLNQKHVQQ